jgi:hypothetical protein
LPGDDAEGVVDDPARALGCAYAAGDALLLVNDGEVIDNMNGIGRADALAGAAGNAACLAYLACSGPHLVIRAEHLYALMTRNDLDDVLLAHARAEATSYACVAVDSRHAIPVKLNRMHAAGGNARAAPDTPV